MRRAAACALLAALACRARGPVDAAALARKECVAFEAAAEAPLGAALRRLDEVVARTNGAARLEAAQGALQEANTLREVLEARPAPAGLEYAWGEELTFANHAVDGLAVFTRSDGGREALERLRSVLARGRTHRDRGRAAIAESRRRS